MLHCWTDTGPVIFLPPATLTVMFLLDMSLWGGNLPRSWWAGPGASYRPSTALRPHNSHTELHRACLALL